MRLVQTSYGTLRLPTNDRHFYEKPPYVDKRGRPRTATGSAAAPSMAGAGCSISRPGERPTTSSRSYPAWVSTGEDVGPRRTPTTLSVGRLLDLWLERIKDDVGPPTLGGYRIFAGHYLKDLRDLPLKALDASHVQKLIDEKRKRSPRRPST